MVVTTATLRRDSSVKSKQYYKFLEIRCWRVLILEETGFCAPVFCSSFLSGCIGLGVGNVRNVPGCRIALYFIFSIHHASGHRCVSSQFVSFHHGGWIFHCIHCGLLLHHLTVYSCVNSTLSDYILSYFLEGDGGGASHVGSSIPTAADFASTFYSNRHDPNSSSDPLHSLRVPATTDEEQHWAELPPPTPAVQFYSHTPQTSNAQQQHHHQHHNQSSLSSRQSNENIQLNHANYKGYPLTRHAQQPGDGQSKTSPTSSQQPKTSLAFSPQPPKGPSP